MSNSLPDIPRPFFWTNDNVHVAVLKARDTQWCADHNTPSEALGLIKILSEGEYQLQLWQYPKGSGNWVEVPTTCATLEEAANMLWTLCQLGEISFSFPEKRNET